jgi:chromosome segregation ATPase
MSNIAERYTRLCRSYVQLADKFQQLDIDHMSLRGQVAPLLKSLKTHQLVVEKLQQEKAQLEVELQTVTTHYEELKPLVQEKVTWEATLQAVTAKYEALRPLEALLEPEVQTALTAAEEQLDLVDETLQEMAIAADPDLDAEAKQLLADYAANPQAFTAINLGMPLPDLRLSQLEREKVLIEP